MTLKNVKDKYLNKYNMDEKYTCNICKKNYKSHRSLWNHNKKFHSNISKVSPEISPQMGDKGHFIHEISPQMGDIKSDLLKRKTDKRQCEFCNIIFSTYKHLHRHLTICKIKLNTSIQDTKLEELKKNLIEMINIRCKVHPKTLKKINNILTNNNNINNGTINNINIHIVPFGKEDTTNVLSQKTKREILNRKHQALYACIEKVHFNKDYPQFNNIMITNMKTNEAHIYNDDTKSFILANKDDVIGDLIDNRLTDIEEFKELLIDDLPPGTIDIINKLVDKWDNGKDVQDKVKLILFNNRQLTIDNKTTLTN
jgi:hypothetical protein